jgi:predicted GNAT family acetyltransferase
MEIIHENGISEGAFLATEGGRVVGEMTYIWSGGDHFIINHTEVINQYQGQGVGKKMVEKAVEFARENNYTISATCPYAQYIFDQNPEYNDVRKSKR